MRRPLLAAWSCAALAAGAVAAGLTLQAADPDPSRRGLDLAAVLALCVPMLAAGVLIARGHPRNAVGAVVAALGLVLTADFAFDAWAGAAVRGDVAGVGWAVLLYQEDWIPVFGVLALLLLLFPDGRPPGPRWRWPVWLAVASTAAALLAASFRGAPFDPPYTSVERPLPEVAGGGVMALALAALTLALVLAAAAAIVRFRRSRGVERTQMKWLAAAAALLPVAIVVGTVDGVVNDDPGPATAIAFFAAILALTAAVVVAMLRHGLYDVDRVISRTIAWIALTLVLAAGAAALALLVAEPLGGGSAAGAAAAAVAAALAFDPLRRRLQRLVDRRFDGDRWRAVARVEAFADRLHDGEEAPEGIEGVLREALGDPGLRLLVWLPGPGAYATLDGSPAAPPAPGRARP